MPPYFQSNNFPLVQNYAKLSYNNKKFQKDTKSYKLIFSQQKNYTFDYSQQMQGNFKKGLCHNCKHLIQIPMTECVTQCQGCRQIVIFVCHIVRSDGEPRVKIRCDVCHSFHTLILCPKCKGYSAIRNFMSGFPYECPCEYKSTLVVCNACYKILSLPHNKNYEKTAITCKSCQNQFKYSICTYCRADIYKRGSDQSDHYPCPNPDCPGKQPNMVNPYEQADQVNQRLDRNVRDTLSKLHNNEENQTELCKICLNKEANMINTTCYHLSVCEGCATSIKKQCPICRAKGEYKKVFKS